MNPDSNSTSNRIPIIVGILVVVVLIVASYVLFTFQSRVPANQVAFQSRVPANQVATMTVRFVDSALDEKTGTFNLFFACDKEKGTCEPSNDENLPPHMGYAIMSLKRVGEETGNTAYVAKADAIIKITLERCETDIKHCEWNFFPIHDYYKSTGDSLYRDAMVKLGDSLLAKRPIGELINNNVPIKWERLYDVTQEKKYKNQLLALADEIMEKPIAGAKEIYTIGDFSVDDMLAQAMWAVVVPAYRVSKDPKYLVFAEDFFDKARIEDNVDKFLRFSAGISVLLKGLESILDISSLDTSRTSEYRDKAKKISGAFLQERWDTPERTLVNGDYGVIIHSTTNSKTTNLQGWLTVLLLQLGEEKISVK